MSKVKWWVVYNELANGLKIAYRKNNNNFLSFLKKNKQFVLLNTWITDSYLMIDPIHIFTSLSRAQDSENLRINRINNLLKILKKKPYDEIDFLGCPLVKTSEFLRPHSEKEIESYWGVFLKVMSFSPEDELAEVDIYLFESLVNSRYDYYTIFLYWIRSDVFLPLDQNVMNFFETTNYDKQLNLVENYISLVNSVKKYNYFGDNIDSNQIELYGEYGLFREICISSYKFIELGESFDLSFHFMNFSKDILKHRSLQNDLTTEQSEALSEVLNMGFKLIAIKTTDKEDNLNILKTNSIYYFQEAFKINDDEIEYDSDKDINIYNQDKLKINISAIVGKNGAGKSTLIELLFRIINNVAYSLRSELKADDITIESVEAHLYYVSSGKLKCIYVNDADVVITEYSYQNRLFKKESITRKMETQNLHSFFYSVAVNYSHYSLNSIYLGNWIKELFHKNDSYQVPIVINPMRTDGNFDINTENDLLNQRLVSNLFTPIESESDIGIRQITDDLKVEAVKFSFKYTNEKINFIFKVFEKNKEVHKIFNPSSSQKSLIIKNVFKVFKVDEKHLTNTKFINCTKSYIIRKLVKISMTYELYKPYFNEKSMKFSNPNFIDYLKKLKNDSSHITNKLNQAINYLKYYKLIDKKNEFILGLDDVENKRRELIDTYDGIADKKLIELIPPPIFSIDITLSTDEGDEIDFIKLSSGEKQQIHSISSILYHIKNIDSVYQEGLISYNNINYILDEIDLYYHPEMQQRYINYLITMIGKLTLTRIDAINIILATHSPYILSDIPSTNVIRLKKGIPLSSKREKTFGSNIHDLLANDFFMENGYMGTFAKKTIEKLIVDLNYLALKKKYLDLVNLKEGATGEIVRDNVKRIEKELRLLV